MLTLKKYFVICHYSINFDNTDFFSSSSSEIKAKSNFSFAFLNSTKVPSLQSRKDFTHVASIVFSIEIL